ncbi:DUF4834 family protein [Dysgonomonas sp. 511]|uniref:DUF4834 family protein n=1 Tax=Dysgonomonas sp. 511 TaxID=2302930 RepID=UPI0013D7F3FF|nr:DUF4834 family protein [Dysgonomonas sp. 511]NDV79582.1 DUF4834 family protein [Dysgonomonas sp. 511]
MTFLFFILFSVFAFGIIMLLSIVRGVSSFIFGKQTAYNTSSGNNGSRKQNTSSSYSDSSQSSEKPAKVFSKEEGEYVSYEEIKE